VNRLSSKKRDDDPERHFIGKPAVPCAPWRGRPGLTSLRWKRVIMKSCRIARSAVCSVRAVA
jgi:hypothetical protein